MRVAAAAVVETHCRSSTSPKTIELSLLTSSSGYYPARSDTAKRWIIIVSSAPPMPLMPTCYVPMELVLVLDESGSMWPYTQAVKDLANSVHAQFEMSSHYTRIGVVEFSFTARTATPLTSFRSEIESAISTFRPSGGTHITAGLEAAQAIARQLRLRNLGGIIIIDFIDMQDVAHREQITRLLERCLARDPARSVICPVSPLGLVEMTRKRTRESLGHILCEPCPACEGRGYIKTVDTV